MKLALGLILALALLAPSFANAGSRSFSSGTCVGGGYTYKYVSSTHGGTYHTYGSNCFKTVRLTFVQLGQLGQAGQTCSWLPGAC